MAAGRKETEAWETVSATRDNDTFPTGLWSFQYKRLQEQSSALQWRPVQEASGAIVASPVASSTRGFRSNRRLSSGILSLPMQN